MRKRTEVPEGYVQEDKTACRLLHGQVDQSIDWSCMEKRDNQGEEYTRCGIGRDDGGS